MEICSIARKSVPAFFPDCEVIALPVADGGEGTVECFLEALQAQRITVPVTGPYGEPLEASYCKDGSRAVIEMASAAGLPMVEGRLDPEKTTTYGVGQLIGHAIDSGCTEILLGLGGSCTNDGGCGCAAALGVRFYEAQGRAFVPTGANLDQIQKMDVSEAQKRLNGVKITVMCDVENPLHGPAGAAHVFAPQKGADEAMVQRLDARLQALDRVIAQELKLQLGQIPGAGAAGGMGAGCMAFLGAELKSGIEAVLDLVEFDRCLEGAGLVITGEGRIDAQSVHGKVISGVAKRTRPRKVPLIAIVGGIGPGAEEAYDLGVTAMFGTDRPALDFRLYPEPAAVYYQRTLEDVLRLIQAVSK